MLLERDSLLASLRSFHDDAAAAAGSVVFVSGEAGIGKSTLLRSFCDGLPASDATRWGFCDALGTPRALGPLHDIARTGQGQLATLISGGADRHTVFSAFLDLIGAAPSVTVIEDAHWADEATLDLLLFVGRRVSALPAMVVVTYRPEEVGRDHPLRRVLGDLATAAAVRRLEVPALSVAAVSVLAEAAGRDSAQVHAITGGNPFFVTEALSVSERELPTTVRDAVLTRASRLGDPARAVLDVISLVPDRAEISLVESALALPAAPSPGRLSALDEGIHSGMLVHDDAKVRFRHELARRAVESDVPAARAAVLHGLILDQLAATDAVDPARLAYHADAAGDPVAVLRYAPPAGRQAAALGAHREAAAQYARALRHAAAAPTAQQADLWERRADECDRTGDLADALEASGRAVELWHGAGETEREASVRARRTMFMWNAGRDAEATESARAAVALLEPLPPGPVLAQAYAALAMRSMIEHDYPAAIEAGDAAIAMARRYGDEWVLSWGLIAVGSARWPSEPDRAVELLSAAVDAGRRAQDDLAVGAAMTNVGAGAAESRRYDVAERWLDDAVAWCTDRDLDSMRSYALAWRASCRMERGRWVEAVASATEVVTGQAQHVPSQIMALTVLGRVRARRGDPDPLEHLDRAWTLAEPTGDLGRLWPVAAARAECAWLAGAPERIEALVAPTYRLALRFEHAWAAGELGYWLRKAGAGPEPVPQAAGPWGLQLGGDPGAAAELWTDLGCPYEAALSLADVGSPQQQLTALRRLHEMGAWPAAEQLARRLRRDGIRSLPRPVRRSTHDNPAQLTDRQVDVLDLLVDDLGNTEIAARLHISPRTVDHHVSAILAKLKVESRKDAARWWARR